MKKLIVTIGILTTVAVASSYAQGTVVFGNATTTKISTNSGPSGVTGVGLVAPNSTQAFYYALFYSTTQTTVAGSTAGVIGLNGGTYAFNATGWSDGNANGYSTNAGAGRLQNSNPNTDGSYSVTGVAGGASADFVIIGWSANIGSTVTALQQYLAAPTQNGWVGESAVGGPLTTGILGSTPAIGLFGASSPNIPGFVLGEVVVPEPGTLALCALGGASMLLFRRKK
jgi:hypothetical protein